MNHKTIGEVTKELLQKESSPVSPIDVEREAHKDYEKHIEEAVDRGIHDFDGDFFIVVLTKKERILERVLRNYFFARKSCPTPDYDQTVYHFHRNENALEFLWVLPSEDTCKLFLDNVLLIHPEEKELLSFIMQDKDGELLALSKKINREIKKSNKLEDC